MATAEISTLEKVEKELSDFQLKLSTAQTSLKDELAKAKTEYDSLVKEIEVKYNVNTLNEDIKRHSYFLKLLKGEVAIPDDLNAKKGKAAKPAKGDKALKTLEVPADFKSAKTAVQKITFAINALGEADNATIAEFISKETGDDVKKVVSQISAALTNLKKDSSLKFKKDGKKYYYSLA